MVGHCNRIRPVRSRHLFCNCLIDHIVRIRHVVMFDLELFRIFFRCRPFRTVQCDTVVQMYVASVPVIFQVVGKDLCAESEYTVRDHKVRDFAAVFQRMVLQRRDSLRYDHDRFHSPGQLYDRILGLVGDKSSGRGKIGIALIHFKSRYVHHIKGVGADVSDIRADPDLIDDRILRRMGKQVIEAERPDPDRLDAVRKIKGGEFITLEEGHVLESLNSIRKYDLLDCGLRKGAVTDHFRAVFHFVLAAFGARELDQGFAVAAVEDAVHRLIIGIFFADRDLREIIAPVEGNRPDLYKALREPHRGDVLYAAEGASLNLFYAVRYLELCDACPAKRLNPDRLKPVGKNDFLQGGDGQRVSPDLRHFFAPDLCRDDQLFVLSAVAGDHSFFSGDIRVERPLFRRDLFIIPAVVQIQLNVIRAVHIAVDVLDHDLTDKVAVKFRRGFHLDPEALFQAQWEHFIPGGLPFIVRQHVPFTVALRRVGDASGVDERLIVGDIDGGLSACPRAPGTGCDVEDARLPLTGDIPGSDHDFLILIPFDVHKFVSRSEVAADRLINAFLSVSLRLHTGQRHRRFFHIRGGVKQHGIGRDMQDIVLIRLDHDIGRCDREIAKSVPLQYRVIGAGRISHLLFRKLHGKFLAASLDRGNRPVRVCALLPGIHVGVDKLRVALGERALFGVQFFRDAVELLVVAGKIDGHAGCAAYIGGISYQHLIQRVVDRLALLRIQLFQVPRQVSEVQHIVRVFLAARGAKAKRLGPGSRLVDLGITAFLNPLRHGFKESARALDQRVCLAQIHGGQRHVRVKEFRLVGLIVAAVGIDDGTDDGPCVIRAVERAQKAVIPAAAGLQLLRSDQILRVIFPQICRLDAAHQAGVKPDPVQLLSAGEYGPVHGAAQFFE